MLLAGPGGQTFCAAHTKFVAWYSCIVLLVASTTAANAGEAPKIVVLSSRKTDATSAQLLAELGDLGFEVILPEMPLDIGIGDGSDRAARETAASRSHAAALIEIASSGGSVVIWIRDRATGRLVLREIATAGDVGEGRVGTLALRAVEVLRASLIEIGTSQPPAPRLPAAIVTHEVTNLPTPIPQHEIRRTPTLQSVPPGAADNRVVVNAPSGSEKPSINHFSSEFGPAVSFSPGGLSAASQASISLHWLPTRYLGASLTGVFPVIPVVDSAKEGSSAVRLTMVAAEARLTPLAGRSIWSPVLGAGGAIVWLQASVTDTGPLFHGHSSGAPSGGPCARVGIGVALAPSVRAHLDLLSGVAVQRVVLTYAGRDVATWGHPFFLFALGAELGARKSSPP